MLKIYLLFPYENALRNSGFWSVSSNSPVLQERRQKFFFMRRFRILHSSKDVPLINLLSFVKKANWFQEQYSVNSEVNQNLVEIKASRCSRHKGRSFYPKLTWKGPPNQLDLKSELFTINLLQYVIKTQSEYSNYLYWCQNTLPLSVRKLFFIARNFASEIIRISSLLGDRN